MPVINRIKILSLGHAEVGKSCIIKRYCEKRFVHKYLSTIGIDYGVTRVTLNSSGGTDIKVNIFDLAGSNVFYEVRNEFYKDVQGAILVYDVSDKSSFSGLETWITEVKKVMGGSKEFDNLIIAVCANKIDMKDRVVDESAGRLWCDMRGLRYFETSALTGQGITEVFEALFQDILAVIETGTKPTVASTVTWSQDQIDMIRQIKSAKDNYEVLGLKSGASKDDVNKSYRKLAVLLHPDKCLAPGSEEVFKKLTTARNAIIAAAPS